MFNTNDPYIEDRVVRSTGTRQREMRQEIVVRIITLCTNTMEKKKHARDDFVPTCLASVVVVPVHR